MLEPGEVLLVPPERARELFSRHPGLGDLVLRSPLLRRALAIEDGASMQFGRTHDVVFFPSRDTVVR